MATGTPPPILQVHGLTKTFNGTRALDDVDVSIAPAEVHALVGQNGSGKSTFIKILAGFHMPDAGATAEVAGQRFVLGDASAAYDAGLRFVHQDLGVVGALNTVENLALGMGYRTRGRVIVNWHHHREQACRAIQEFGHDFDIAVPLNQLSIVQRTVVALARALQGEAAQLLVLDEPTSAMPAPDVQHLLELVRTVRDRGTSVLYVSHRLGEIFEVADRLTVLRDGHGSPAFSVADLTRSQVVELMTGSVVDEAPQKPERPLEDPALTLVDLSGGVVRSADLKVSRGEIVGVAGISGSGRDELCDLIFGGLARRGEVSVGGFAVPERRPDQSMRRGMALVPADRLRFGVIKSLSVRENLTLPDLRRFASRVLISRRTERAAARSWIERFGVKTRGLEAPIETLSGGNQQKVVLAKCLMVKPTVLLLDEPTQGVDVAAKADIHRQIDAFAQDGGAVLVCSSDNEELERLCDRVVVFQNGRLATELSGADVNLRRLTQETLGVEIAGGAGVRR